MYLLDTNVISAMSPAAMAENRDLIFWIEQTSFPLFLAAVTASEIEQGISRAERIGAVSKARKLRQWWDAIMLSYAERILPLDLSVAIVAGQMMDRFRGHSPGYVDVAIAATARVHELTVLTRNERHFVPLDVPVQNPFRQLPPLAP